MTPPMRQTRGGGGDLLVGEAHTAEFGVGRVGDDVVEEAEDESRGSFGRRRRRRLGERRLGRVRWRGRDRPRRRRRRARRARPQRRRGVSRARRGSGGASRPPGCWGAGSGRAREPDAPDEPPDEPPRGPRFCAASSAARRAALRASSSALVPRVLPWPWNEAGVVWREARGRGGGGRGSAGGASEGDERARHRLRQICTTPSLSNVHAARVSYFERVVFLRHRLHLVHHLLAAHGGRVRGARRDGGTVRGRELVGTADEFSCTRASETIIFIRARPTWWYRYIQQPPGPHRGALGARARCRTPGRTRARRSPRRARRRSSVSPSSSSSSWRSPTRDTCIVRANPKSALRLRRPRSRHAGSHRPTDVAPLLTRVSTLLTSSRRPRQGDVPGRPRVRGVPRVLALLGTPGVRPVHPYPHALFFLDQLRRKEFSTRHGQPRAVEHVFSQQFYHWQKFRTEQLAAAQATDGAAV